MLDVLEQNPYKKSDFTKCSQKKWQPENELPHNPEPEGWFLSFLVFYPAGKSRLFLSFQLPLPNLCITIQCLRLLHGLCG